MRYSAPSRSPSSRTWVARGMVSVTLAARCVMPSRIVVELLVELFAQVVSHGRRLSRIAR